MNTNMNIKVCTIINTNMNNNMSTYIEHNRDH